jgi:hypothetical protein
MNLHVHKIKSIAGRATAFATAVAFMGGIVSFSLPGIASADALNPLTQRSLMLSSSSPGWAFTDGSDNATFAPPGSGANGQKTSETFSFRVSTDSVATSTPIKAMSFQYCTGAAGDCIPPGNVGAASPGVGGESNMDVVYASPAENTDFNVYSGEGTTLAEGLAGTPTITASSGWSMTVYRLVDSAGTTTTEKNFIILKNSTGISPTYNTKIWVKFKASASKYITNPGEGPFFVRLSTFNVDGTAGTSTDDTDTNGIPDEVDPTDVSEGIPHVLDGGVTVANVMNESIHITTKVLETMAFSVGTVNPDTVDPGAASHGGCDAITVNDEVRMGDPAQEYSLSPFHAFDATSYWRLSTNSSGGATVYYSGATLNNTVGDDINAIGPNKAHSQRGIEQFGLAIDTRADTLDTNGTPPGPAPTNVLTPLVAAGNYANGSTPTPVDDPTAGNNAEFAFDAASNTEPVAIASNSSGVLTCSTGKMRYVANIAPFTPAGVYTTKVNYIAAPRY